MGNTDNNDEREKYCSVCRRSESRAGKLIRLPGDMCVCTDCVQRMIDSMASTGIDFTNPSSLMGFSLNGTTPPANGPGSASDGGRTEKSTSGETTAEVAAIEETSGSGEALEGEVVTTPEEEPKKTPDKQEKKEPPKKKQVGIGIPGLGFINISDLQGGAQKRQQVKKRKPGEKKDIIDPAKVLPPHKLKAKLDEYVVGQEKAKKIISVAVYNHYKRVIAGESVKDENDIEIEKSNVLMIGPTGSGKTHIVRTLAKLLDVPLAITDATTLTEAGYIGDDIESVVSKLLAAADNDVDKAEVGIIFIDEIDKIAKKNSTRGRDVSGESVQQGLLKMLEGSEVEVPVGATSKNAMVPLTTINTKNILFICGGAFPDLNDIIKERLTETSSIGFNAELKDKYDQEYLLDHVETEDLRRFGMIPEFLGRLPIVCTLQELDADMLVRVLREPKNAILKQYSKLLELDEVDLEFEDDALHAIAERAIKKQAGARGLRSIIEEVMLDIMYEIPKDDSIGKVIITRDYIEGHGAPVIEIRGSGRHRQPVPELTAAE